MALRTATPATKRHSFAFKPRARSILHERTLGLAPYIVGWCYILTVAIQFRDFYRALFSYNTVFVACFLSVAGILLVGTRNYNVSVSPVLPTAGVKEIGLFALRISSFVYLGFYTIVSILFQAFVLAGWSSANYSSLVIHVREEGFAQVNGYYVLYRTFAIVLSISYTLFHIAAQKDWIRFSTIQLDLPKTLRNNAAKIVKNSVTIAAHITVAFWILYHIVLCGPLVRFAEGYTNEEVVFQDYTFMPRWFNIFLFIGLLLESTCFVLFLEIIHAMSGHILSQRMNVVETSSDPNVCLLSGLQLSIDGEGPLQIVRYHAFQELNHLAGNNPAWRAGLFGDAFYNAIGWSQVSAECLKTLRQSQATLTKQQGGAPVAQTLIEPVRLSESYVQLRKRLDPGKGGAVESATLFKKQKSNSVFDSFKGKSTEELIKANVVNKPEEGIPVLVERTKPEVAAARWVWQQLRLQLGKISFVRQWLAKPEDATKKTTAIYNDYQLEIWASQSLARLVMASVKEDQTGVVQQDWKTALNVLLDCRAAASAAATSVSLSSPSTSKLVQFTSGPKVLVRVLDSCIYQVVLAVRPRLNELKLEQCNLGRLQPYLDLQI